MDTSAKPDVVLDPAAPDQVVRSDDLVARSNRFLVQAIATTELGDRSRIRAVRRWLTGYAGELRVRYGQLETGFDDLIERLEAVLLLWSERPDHEAASTRALVLALQIDRVVSAVQSRSGIETTATLGERGWFPIAWYLNGIDPDVRRAMLDLAPVRTKLVYFLTRGRYERLVRRAFGGGGVERVGCDG
jgi:hypothetical protein